MSSSVEYAKSELARITKDGDGLQDAINKNILDIVELFASQGHGEISAGYTMSITSFTVQATHAADGRR